ncbi:MAG: hypothetical protein Q7T81_06725 [Pseudolabrys sp.]|nr:hypothetical protein [Pseudolabrys sp.]
MKRHLALAAALIAAFAFTMPTAEAGGRHHRGHISKEIKTAAIVTGAAATVAYFAINDWRWRWDNGSGLTSLGAYAATTLGCAAVSPMVATALVKRPLTMREGHVLVGSCVLPIIGGWLVNEAYNNNPQWEGGVAPAPHKRHHRRVAKK